MLMRERSFGHFQMPMNKLDTTGLDAVYFIAKIYFIPNRLHINKLDHCVPLRNGRANEKEMFNCGHKMDYIVIHPLASAS